MLKKLSDCLRRHTFLCCVVLTGMLVLSVVAGISLGTAKISFSTVWRIILHNLFGLFSIDDIKLSTLNIVWRIRIPRALLGMVVGGSLTLSGISMQAFTKNPLAEPYVLGISSGASAGASLALLTPIQFLAGQRQTTAFAFLGALLSALVVYSLAKKAGGGKLRPVTLLLSGTAVNAVMSAVTSFLIFRAKSPEGIAAVYSWQMGSISAAQWKTLTIPAIFVVIGTVVFTLMGTRFNMMMMGDEDAAAMGLRVRLFRSCMFLVCSLVVASLVSITGIVGFVGLVVPHVTRLISRTNDNRIVMPMSALLGAVFILWADAFARCAFGAVELPIGIVTAFILSLIHI